jgi:hypothetical protein
MAGTYETRLRLVSETNVNVTNNTSYVTIALEFRRTDYSYYGYNQTGSAYWYINCDGQSAGNTYFTFNWNIPQNSWYTVGQRSFTITHDADGGKYIGFSGGIFFGSGVSPGTLTGSGSATLQTIPRATTPSLSETNVTMGESITIDLPRATSSFTHNLSYKFGNASGTIATGAGTSATFTIPTSLSAQLPNAASGTGNIICDTYNGSTLIGSKTVSFVATVPASVVPVISSVTVSDTVQSIQTKFGVFVQNKSKARVVTTAEGAQGSSISNYKVTVDGTNYSGADITTNYLASAGDIEIKVTVTDTRGRTATKSQTVNVLEYRNPSIRTFSVYRCTDDGTEDDEASGAKLVIAFDIAPIENKNTRSYTVQTKNQDESGSAWTTILSGNVYAYDSSYIKTGSVLDTDCSYLVRLTVADYFMSVTAEVEIGPAFTLMDFHHSGRGAAFGKVSQKEGYLEVNQILELLKGAVLHGVDDDGNAEQVDIFKALKSLESSLSKIADFIVEQGTNGVWTYRKWNKGIAECWATLSPDNNGSTGNYWHFGTNFPFTFNAKPSMSLSGGSTGDPNAMVKYSSASTTGFEAYLYSSVAGGSGKSGWLSVYVIGKLA